MERVDEGGDLPKITLHFYTEDSVPKTARKVIGNVHIIKSFNL